MMAFCVRHSASLETAAGLPEMQPVKALMTTLEGRLQFVAWGCWGGGGRSHRDGQFPCVSPLSLLHALDHGYLG